MTQDSNPPTETEMRPEYDFKAAVRGCHHKPLHKGYTVQIHHADGTTTQQQHILPEGVVWLDPDVRQHFPDSEAVNKALRSLAVLLDEMGVPHAEPV